jgi:hypothetical protein
MTMFIRLAAGVLCCGVLALAVVCFDPACLLNVLHGWAPDKKASMAEELARKEQLDQREAVLRRQRQAKRTVAAEVIARRRSLAEAIEQFRALDREWPESLFAPRGPADVGMSEDECSGRDVLYFVGLVLADRPDEAAAVADRLEKELQQFLADRRKRRPEPENPRLEKNRDLDSLRQREDFQRLLTEVQARKK